MPTILYWLLLTSLAFHLMVKRKEKTELLEKTEAQVHVLNGLIERYQRALSSSDSQPPGHDIDEQQVQRELEMVGLRERTKPVTEDDDLWEGREVSWKEVFMGRKRSHLTEKEQEDAARKEWEQVINAASRNSQPPPDADENQSSIGAFLSSLRAPPPSQHAPGPPPKRAPSAEVYM